MHLIGKRWPSLAISLTTATSLVGAAPELAFPVNSQVPPVAYASKSFDFTFSASTFESSAAQISYSLTNAPTWLDLDSGSRTFTGTPQQGDVGAATFELIASDATGQSSTSVTFVVQDDKQGVHLGESVFPQLQRSGLASAPDSFLSQPEKEFDVRFEQNTFTGTTSSTRYYAVSADNSPLPPWILFNESNLSFSGTTPSLVSSLSGPQSYGVKLVASNVPGFAEAAAEFSIVISARVFAFEENSTSFKITPGVKFETDPLRPLLRLNDEAVPDEVIASVEAVVPDGLQLDKQNLIVSGVLAEAVNATITITVNDIYGDVAQTTLILETSSSSINQTIALGTIANLNVTIGTFFSFSLTEPAFSTSLRAAADLGNASSWLTFDRRSWVLAGQVPSREAPAVLNIPIRFENATTTETALVVIMLQESAPNGTSSTTMSTVGPTVAKGGPTSSPSDDSPPAAAAGTYDIHVLHIVLATVFSGIGVLLLLSLALCCWRSRKRDKTSKSISEESPPMPSSETTSSQPSQPVLYGGRPITVHRTPPPRPSRIDLAWSNDSFRQSRQRLSGSMRPSPLSLHRTSQLLGPDQVWSLESAMAGAASESARPSKATFTASPPPNEPLPAQPAPAVLGRASTSAGQSQARPVSRISRRSLLPPFLGLQDRRSGAGHGSGILVQSDLNSGRTSWRNSWLTNTSADSRRTTAVLNSFPDPPGDRTGALSPVRPTSHGKHRVPVLRVVSEDSTAEMTFEQQRQRWHTERARARSKLEGGARFSNAGSTRTVPMHQTLRRVLSSSTVEEQEPSATPAVLKPHNAEVASSREHSWSKWSGVGPAAQTSPRMLRSRPSVASSGQFESVASSNSQWGDENLTVHENEEGVRRWQTAETGSSQASPRLPFSPVLPPRENMAGNRDVSAESSKQQSLLADRRKHISVEAGGLQRSYGSQRGSFRFI